MPLLHDMHVCLCAPFNEAVWPIFAILPLDLHGGQRLPVAVVHVHLLGRGAPGCQQLQG